MTTKRVFRSSNSQAVRLPKEFSVKSRELEIFRRGDEIILREPTKGIERAFELLTKLPDDFLSEGRIDTPPQSRIKTRSHIRR
jgi:antitoxin VapB